MSGSNGAQRMIVWTRRIGAPMNREPSTHRRRPSLIAVVIIALVLSHPNAARAQITGQPQIAPPHQPHGGNPVLQVPSKRSVPPIGSQKGGSDSSPPTGHAQQELEIPRVGQMSQKLLGCWSGETAPAPVKWQVIAPDGARLEYRTDRIHLCLSGVRGELRVTALDSNDPGPLHVQYKVSYRPVRANMSEVEMEMKGWDPSSPISYVETGTARCTLNPDGTVTYSHSLTAYLDGNAALLLEARAELRREP